MNESITRWLRAIVISLIVVLILSVYLYLRRGYYNLYIINKVFGSTAVVLTSITLLIGPLRSISFIAYLMTIRRHLGLSAFVFAILHVIFSLAQTERFTWFSWYGNEWIPVSFGVLALGVWVYMTFISRSSKIKEMGTEVWKKQLSFSGNLAFLAIFLHLTSMKYIGWIRWWNGEVKQTAELANPQYPPASLFIFALMLIVIVYRVFSFLYRRFVSTSMR